MPDCTVLDHPRPVGWRAQPPRRWPARARRDWPAWRLARTEAGRDLGRYRVPVPCCVLEVLLGAVPGRSRHRLAPGARGQGIAALRFLGAALGEKPVFDSLAGS